MKAFQLPPKTQAKLVKATPHKEFDSKNPPRQAISLKLRATLSLAMPGQSQRGYPSRFFSDRKHGGKRKAYEAALAAERKLMRGAQRG